MANIVFSTATIANGATTSDVIDCTNGTISSFYLPAAFTSTAITFSSSDEPNGTYQTIYDTTNTALSFTVGQGRNYTVNPANFVGHRFVKFIGGSSEGGARSIKVGIRQFV